MMTLDNPEKAAAWLRSKVIGELQTDSRKIESGDGFIAWPGATLDGRQFVTQALNQDARACLVERRDALEKLSMVDAQSTNVASYVDLKAATGLIAAAYYANPSRQLDVIAVTGTNGKTSSVWWLAQALSTLKDDCKSQCGMVGTLGIGQPVLPNDKSENIEANVSEHEIIFNGLTTPDPVQLQKAFRHFVASNFTACAIEASSIGIAEHRLVGTAIKVAVFTNFSQDHLDYHGSMGAYWQAKLQLFNWPKLQSAVVNVDDEKGQTLCADLSATPLDVWSTSIVGEARLKARNIAYGQTGLGFDVIEGAQTIRLQTATMGEYNVSNILGVIAVMRALGVALASAVDACTRLTAVPGRMDCISRAGQPTVVVDYAHTPDALKNTLLGLRHMTKARQGKLICVFGCGGNRDASKRVLMAKVAEQYADQVCVTTDNPRNENPQDIIQQVMQGFNKPADVIVVSNRALAIAHVVRCAASQDVILIAGKGHENYQEIKHEKHYFSDKEQALSALQELTRRNAA